MPSASYNHSAIVDAPRLAVWAALDKPETWNSIPGVERVHQPEIDGEGRLRGFLFDTVVGGTAYEGKARPHERNEGHLMSWDVANSQVKGRIEVEIEDVGHQTNLTVGVHIANNSFLAGMFFGSIAKVVGDGLPDTVEALAASLAGEQ